MLMVLGKVFRGREGRPGRESRLHKAEKLVTLQKHLPLRGKEMKRLAEAARNHKHCFHSFP